MIHIAELQAKANLIIGERISGKKKRRSDIPVDSDVGNVMSDVMSHVKTVM